MTVPAKYNSLWALQPRILQTTKPPTETNIFNRQVHFQMSHSYYIYPFPVQEQIAFINI